jgi:uncharacterized protein
MVSMKLMLAGIKIELATSFLARAKGLLGRKTLAADQALLIKPCSAVHTCGMQFPIDVIFLNADGQILSIHHAVKAWTGASSRGASAALELASGVALARAWQVGERLAQIDPKKIT